MENTIVLASYGAVSKNFAIMAKLKKELQKVKAGLTPQHRVDCYNITDILCLREKFLNLKIKFPENVEIFYPSENYPPHSDGGGISYFIPLESGNFYIDGISYPVVPFVLYSFDDGVLHNTNFCAIMLK